MGVNIWNNLTVGIDREFRVPKRKFWYEIIPGFAFKAVWFGRQRKLWFREKEYLILYRYDVLKKSECCIAWISVSQLIEREMSNIIDKDYNK
jgi:hypothetical protein